MDCFTGFLALELETDTAGKRLCLNDFSSCRLDYFMSHISCEASPYSETKFMELPTSFSITQSLWDWRVTLS